LLSKTEPRIADYPYFKMSKSFCYFIKERSQRSEFPAKSSGYSVTYMYVNSCKYYR